MGQETIVAELQELDAVSEAQQFMSGVTYFVTGHDRTASEVLYKHGYSVVDVHAREDGRAYIYALPADESEHYLGE